VFYLKKLILLFTIFAGILVVACGGSDSDSTESASISKSTEPSSVSSGGFAELGRDLRAQRMRSASVILQDGRVLVTGGNQPAFQAGAVKTAEVWTAGSDQWEFTDDMMVERFSHSMVVLRDGRVLSAGGRDLKNTGTNKADIWDPKTGNWISAADMIEAHESFPMVLLNDGRVIVAGGSARDYNPTNLAEIYDPNTDSWMQIGGMSVERIWHTGTLLSDGRVLFVGGGDPDGPYIKNAEIYDPAKDIWFSAGEMNVGRSQHTATLLKDGRVLVVGGRGKRQTSEIYDPSTNTWGEIADLNEPRAEHIAIVLSDGRVSVIAGTGSRPSVEVWDPINNSWDSIGKLQIGRYRHLAELLNDNRILVFGGNGEDGILASTEIINIEAGSEVEQVVLTGTADPQLPTPAAIVDTPVPIATPVIVGRDVYEDPLEDPIDAEPDVRANQVPNGQPVRLPIGGILASPSLQTGLVAVFLEVISDTRCPSGETCDEPGQATILLELRQQDAPFGTTEMILGGDQALPSVKKLGKFSTVFVDLEYDSDNNPILTLAMVQWRKK
jgi:deoxycytidylate deaminase